MNLRGGPHLSLLTAKDGLQDPGARGVVAFPCPCPQRAAGDLALGRSSGPLLNPCRLTGLTVSKAPRRPEGASHPRKVRLSGGLGRKGVLCLRLLGKQSREG